MRIALLQMDIQIGEPDMNFARAAEWLEEAVSVQKAPDVIVLPEMWNTGYALDRIQDIADIEGRRTKRMISEFCRKHHIHIIAGSIAEKVGSEVKNTAYVYNRAGELVTEYSKIHLFRLMEEEKHLISGDKVGTFVIEGVPAGVMICYDIRFPELSRKMALDGAQIMFVPAEWPKPRLAHWRTLLIARAIENQAYVISCNRVGISGTTDFFGHSMIIDPWGEIIAEGGETEELIVGDIDLDVVKMVRSKIPVFEDRRPALY